MEGMGAIDLLFEMKPDSERLHQLAIGALLRHCPLLQRLGVTEEAPASHQWEPLGRTFDLGVRLSGGAHAYIELKVDAALGQGQVRQQLQELRAEGRGGDRVLYLLLGYTAISCPPESIRAIAREVGVTDDRVTVRGAAEVARLLGAPEMLWAGAQAPGGIARDARDLAVSYRDHLLLLQQRMNGFFDRPPQQWGDGDYYGFFDHARRTLPGMAGAGIEYVANPSGGFIGCWWAHQAVAKGSKVYLQFEGPRLCVKIKVEAAERRSALRDQACGHLLQLSPPPPLRVVRPAKLGHGQWMTIGYLEGLPFGQQDHLEAFANAVQAAEALVAAVAARMQGGERT
jgi:hypothetical protein